MGKDVAIPEGCRVFDASGLNIVPGFVDAHSHAGIETEGLSAPDANESTSSINPHLRAIDALNPTEEGLQRSLAGGVTTIGLLPGSGMSFGGIIEQIGVISGMGSVIKTKTKDGQVSVLREKAGIKMAVGEHPKRFANEGKKPPNTRLNIYALLRESLEAANGEKTEWKMKNLEGLLKKEYPARIHVHKYQDILSVLRLRDEYDFDLCLEHVTEGYKALDAIKAAGVPCVVGPINFTRRGSELENIRLDNAVILHNAGIKVAITCDHPTFPAWYLPYHAGMLVREGMPYEDALKTVTINAAEILGVSDRVGSLEEGKDADFVAFQGDPLEITTPIKAVVSDGELVAGGADGTASWCEEGGR